MKLREIRKKVSIPLSMKVFFQICMYLFLFEQESATVEIDATTSLVYVIWFGGNDRFYSQSSHKFYFVQTKYSLHKIGQNFSLH